MVFESFVADVLNRFLSKYVKNVDQSQLKIGIWGGDVTLENLLLMEGALDDLDLPIKTTFGQLGKLVLKIPWKNLYTSPVLIYVERLFLLAVPNRDFKYDPVKEEQWLQSAKEYELQKFEEIKRQIREKDKPKVDDTFTEKLIAQIIKNVQFKVIDIHIRYEDKSTHVERPFSLGLTLAHFHLYTTDDNWKEGVVVGDIPKVNKLVDIESLAMYWNCNCRFLKERSLKENTTLLWEFQHTITKKDHQPHDFEYILEPINGLMRLVLNSKPELDDYNIPKYDMDISMETLALGINKLQYQDMIRLGESLNRMALATPYRKYRPQLNIYRGNYRIWWKFAYVCVLEEQVRRVRVDWNWGHIIRHRAKCRKYADAYAAKIMAVKPSKGQEEKVKTLEKNLDVFNILIVRERVEMEVEKAGRQRSMAARTERSRSWFGSVMQRAHVDDSDHVMQSLESAMTPSEKNKLYMAIGYQEKAGPVHYPPTFIDIRVNFNLDTFQIEVTDKRIFKFRVLHLAFSNVNMNLEQRPSGNGIKVKAKIFRLSVYGLKQGHITPLLVTERNLSKDKNLLDLLFEINPLDYACDQRLLVFLRSLEIVHDSKTIQRIFDVFRPPFESSTLHKLQVQLERVKDMSATGLQHAAEEHASLELKIDIKAPYIIVPYGGFYTHHDDILVINLGRLTISSFPRNPANRTVRDLFTKGMSEVSILRTMISQSYDKFFINLENIQVLLVLKGEDWFGVLERNYATPLHLLEPLCFIIVLNNCLIRDDPKLPKAKLTATVHNVAINLTNVRLLHLLKIVSSIPPLDTGKDTEPEQVEVVDNAVHHITDAHFMTMYLKVKAEQQTKEEVMKTKQETSAADRMQAVLFDLTFELECITVKGFLVDMASISFETTEHYFTLAIAKIEVEMAQLTFEIEVTARLGGIVMDVYDVKRLVRIINTPDTSTSNLSETEFLITMNYTQVNKHSPNFHLKYNNTLQILEINFGTLILTLHQEVLLNFVEVVRKFRKNLDKELKHLNVVENPIPAKKHTFKDVQRKVLHRVREKRVMEVLKPKLHQTKHKEEVTLRMIVNIQAIQFSIRTRTIMIVDIEFVGCVIKVTILDSLTKLVMRLRKLEVLDCNPKSLHSIIISVAGREMLSVEIVKFNVCKLFSRATKENPDILLTAKISCIRFIYLNRFISSLFAFYSNVQAVQSLFTVPPRETAQSQKPNMKDYVDDADFILVNVECESPIIIIPLSSVSMDAVTVNLGYVTINSECNVLSVVNGNGVEAAVDCITFKIQNINANRVKLNEDYRVVQSITLLVPFNFEVMIERNLSSWHKHVPDCEITVRVPEIRFTITEEDCKMALKIMNQNFSEGIEVELIQPIDGDIFHSPEKPSHPIKPKQFDSVETFTDVNVYNTSESTRIVTKIILILDGITLLVFTGGAKTLENVSEQHSKTGLARFSLQSLYLGSLVLSNGNERFTFRLCNCYLDDMRKLRLKKHTRLVQLKEYPLLQNKDPQENTHSSYLMAIIYLKTGTSTFVDVNIHSFQVIIGLDYVSEVRAFLIRYNKADNTLDLKPPEVDNIRKVRFALSISRSMSKSVATIGIHQTTSPEVLEVNLSTTTTLNVKVDNPDIIFVERIDNFDNNALFINGEINSKANFVGEKMVFNARVKHLQLYVCCFDPSKRNNTKAMILRPCTISCVGFASDADEFNVDMCVTDVKIDLSPGTIDLFSKIYYAMYGLSTDPSATDDSNVDDYSELWEPKKFSDAHFWFLKEKSSRFDSFSKSNHLIRNTLRKSQICIVSVPSMTITVEAGDGKQRQPMLLIDLKLECLVYDWSANLFINTNLAIQVAYYNTGLAMWEPLLEPVERNVHGISIHHPWDLKIILKFLSQTSSPPHFSKLSLAPEAIDTSQPAAMSISISSSEKLELTLTKTGIEVLSNLSTVIFETNKCSTSVGVTAPYVVKNVCGLPITVVLHKRQFRLMESEHLDSHHTVTLKSGSDLELCHEEEEEEVANEETIKNTNRRHTFSPPNIVGQSHIINKRFLDMRVRADTRGNVLPVLVTVLISRADKRYFSLKHRGQNGIIWGLISDVKICNGGTTITIRSVVKLHNHMKQPFDVYYYEQPGEKSVLCATVHPEDEFCLPLHCIYTASNELFFCPNGYSLTEEPFVWRHLHTAHVISKLLSCPVRKPKNGQPFFINVVGISKPVIFENSHHYTPESVLYDIHLHPAVTIQNLLPLDILIYQQCDNDRDITTVVKAGECIPLVHAEPGKSNILVTLPSYCKTQWISEGHIEWSTSKLDVLQFISDEQSKQKPLTLKMDKEENNGTTCLKLSSQFWMINKTGISLCYRESNEHNNTWEHDTTLKDPVLFSFSGTHNSKNMLSIKLINGDWSDKFSLDAIGSSGVVSCKLKGVVYQIGVSIHLSQSQLTKLVTFAPFYVLVNNHEKCIECQEVDRPQDPWITTMPGDCTPFWPHSSNNQCTIHLRIENSTDTSCPFSFSSSHSTLLKLEYYGGVVVDVHKIDAAAYITFLPYKPGLAPTLLINHTNEQICYFEQNEEDKNTLNAGEMVMFTWNKPMGPRMLTYQLRTKKDFKDDLRTDGVQELLSKSGGIVYWASFLDGFQRVTLFTTSRHTAKIAKVIGKIEPVDMEIVCSLQAIGISLVNNSTMTELMYISALNSDIIWETRSSQKKQFKPLHTSECHLLEAAYNNFSFRSSMGRETEKTFKIGHHLEVNLETKEVIYPPKRYLRRSYEQGVWFRISTSRHQSTMSGKLNRLQIDNQLCNSAFPVLFAPVRLSKTIRANHKRKPFIEWSIVRRYSDNNPIRHYKYFKILVQEFDVKVDMNFVNQLYLFLDWGGLSESAKEQMFHQEVKSANESLLDNVYTTSLREEKSFYEMLHFSPLKIHISFSLSTKTQNATDEESPNFAKVLLRDLGVTITDIHDVVFRLRYFERKNTFSTYNQLYAEVYSHYTNEFLKNAYVLVFGLDLIGNPWGLLMGLGKGMQDFFYEPYLGAIQGPTAFGRGMLLGIGSLLGSAVGGVCGAVSRISGALGRGFAVLTFDHDFQRKRRQSMNNMPPSIRTQLLQSSRMLVMGMFDGVSGVVVKPVSGAKMEGVTGFFKGIGKGVAGLVTRPPVGVFDFISGSFGIVNKWHYVPQVRPARYLDPDGLVRAYILTHAEGNAVLQRLEKRLYASTDKYVYHLTAINGKMDVLLLTDKRVMYVQENSVGEYYLIWQCMWDKLQLPYLNSEGGFTFSGRTRKRPLRLCGSPHVADPVYIKSRHKRRILLKHIEHQTELYNTLL